MARNIPATLLESCSLEELLQPETVIDGGHYVAEEAIDPVCEWSWERAAELYARATRLGMPGMGLMLLIEDFLVPASERDLYRSKYQLPAVYRRTLDRHRVDQDVVTVAWEVQLRNRAHGDVRRRLKPRLSWQDDGYFTRAQDGAQRRATMGTVPVCNLIVGRYVAEKDRLFKNSLNIYDLMWECQSSGGVAVSRYLYDTRITVFNAYVTTSLEIGFVVCHPEREPVLGHDLNDVAPVPSRLGAEVAKIPSAPEPHPDFGQFSAHLGSRC